MRQTAFFYRTLAIVGVLLLETATAHAAIVNLATGLDASDALLTLGNSLDAHWTVDQSSGGIAAAKVVAPGNVDWPGAWLANGPSSSWITIDPDTVANGPVPYSYYRTFTLTVADLATAAISGVWGIDDGGEVRLNGTAISTSPGDYSVVTPFSVATGSGLFVAGANTLEIRMTTSDNVWEAVRLEGRLTTGADSAVPEPCTLAIWSLLGVCGMGVGWRRRKQSA